MRQLARTGSDRQAHTRHPSLKLERRVWVLFVVHSRRARGQGSKENWCSQ